ncbi:MAG: photosynthetic complex assembly protein PuhC [Myxococcota bacterium]
MGEHHDDINIPKPVLGAVGALMLTSLVIAGMARSARVEAAARAAEARPEVAVLFQFGEKDDGSLEVRREPHGEPVAIAPESEGFVRGVLRTFSRTRQREGVGEDAPLELGLYGDGKLVLADPTTDERIELDSFGPTNRGAFARFFEDRR